MIIITRKKSLSVFLGSFKLSSETYVRNHCDLVNKPMFYLLVNQTPM